MSTRTDGQTGLTVITGAASGMGEATAAVMAAEGRRLLLCDLNAGRLSQVAQRFGDRAATLAGDISDPTFGTKLTAAIGDRKVSALAHCAGLSPTMGDPARILEVNLAATMRLVAAILPLMADGSAAVLVASSAGHMMGAALDAQIGAAVTPDAARALISVTPNSGTAYSVSKRGVQMLVRREAGRFGERGARLVSLSPGIIATPMQQMEEHEQPVVKRMVEASALRRQGQASEIASVIAFLCSPAASFVTGVDLLVDGGALAALAAHTA